MYRNGNISKGEQKGNPSMFPQRKLKDKSCRICSEIFSPNTPAALYCTDKCKDRAAADKYLKRTYNIGIERYEELHKEGGLYDLRRSGICPQ